jgi:plastocyanin
MMTNNVHSTVAKYLLAAVCAILLALPGVAQSQVFQFDEDTDFSIGNSGASDYLFNWSGGSQNEADPTLELVAGNTYTFQRTTGSHPFVITDDTLPVAITNRTFARTTTSGTVIDSATLTPLADFTANPAPTTDQIVWTPTEADVGDYFYTCRVTGHTGMTGAIRVVAAPPVFQFDEDTDFSIGNAGASNYLFNWSGGSQNEADPTLELVAGNTYTFQRTSGSHPFVITDATLPVTGTDGSFARTTTSGTVIDAATLTPLADFTADPAPTTDQIVWAPTESDVGDYFYTCRVTGHTGMTGAIRVVSAPPVLLGDVNLDGTVDFLDITPFIGVLSSTTFQAEADCDQSGDVDFLDITPFIAILAGSSTST